MKNRFIQIQEAIEKESDGTFTSKGKFFAFLNRTFDGGVLSFILKHPCEESVRIFESLVNRCDKEALAGLAFPGWEGLDGEFVRTRLTFVRYVIKTSQSARLKLIATLRVVKDAVELPEDFTFEVVRPHLDFANERYWSTEVLESFLWRVDRGAFSTFFDNLKSLEGMGIALPVGYAYFDAYSPYEGIILEALKECVKKDNIRVPHYAEAFCIILGALKSEKAMPVLTQCMNKFGDEDYPDTGKAAAGALFKLGDWSDRVVRRILPEMLCFEIGKEPFYVDENSEGQKFLEKVRKDWILDNLLKKWNKIVKSHHKQRERERKQREKELERVRKILSDGKNIIKVIDGKYGIYRLTKVGVYLEVKKPGKDDEQEVGFVQILEEINHYEFRYVELDAVASAVEEPAKIFFIAPPQEVGK